MDSSCPDSGISDRQHLLDLGVAVVPATSSVGVCRHSLDRGEHLAHATDMAASSHYASNFLLKSFLSAHLPAMPCMYAASQLPLEQ